MANKGPYIEYDEKLGKLKIYVKSCKMWKQYYFPREKKKVECQIVDGLVKDGASIAEVQKFYKQCVKNSTLWKSYTSEKSDGSVQKAPEKSTEIKNEDENLVPDEKPLEKKEEVVIEKIEIKDEPIEIPSEDVSMKSIKFNEDDQDSDQELDELGGKQYHHVAILQCKSSRIINTIFYDHKESVLIITFREPKKCSEAYKAPATFFDDFVKSSSKAKFYSTHFEDPIKKKSKLEKKGVFSIHKEQQILSESFKKYQALINPLKKK